METPLSPDRFPLLSHCFIFLSTASTALERSIYVFRRQTDWLREDNVCRSIATKCFHSDRSLKQQHTPIVGIRQRELVQHDEKQHTPRVGIRQRELVQHDEKQHTPIVGIRQRELVQHDEKQHTPRVGIRQRGLVQHGEKQHTPRVGIRQR